LTSDRSNYTTTIGCQTPAFDEDSAFVRAGKTANASAQAVIAKRLAHLIARIVVFL